MPEQTGVTVIHVCGSGPLHTVQLPGRRKVRFTFHHYLGPTFYRADGDTVIYEPKRWQWEAFETWLKMQPKEKT